VGALGQITLEAGTCKVVQPHRVSPGYANVGGVDFSPELATNNHRGMVGEIRGANGSPLTSVEDLDSSIQIVGAINQPHRTFGNGWSAIENHVVVMRAGRGAETVVAIKNGRFVTDAGGGVEGNGGIELRLSGFKRKCDPEAKLPTNDIRLLRS
jgi:hypothetical protein